MYSTEHKESFIDASKALFANLNVVCIISTAIGYMAIYQALELFTLLYLRDLGISYFQIGCLDLIFSLVSIIAVFIGSWLTDTLLLHQHSRAASANFIMWGIMCTIYSRITGFWSALVVFCIAGVSFTFRSASRAYTLQQSGERKHLAIGYYSLHKIPLVVVFLLLMRIFTQMGFVDGMRSALGWGGVLIMIMGLIRLIALADSQNNMHILKEHPIMLSKLITENCKTIRHLWRVAKMFVLITVLDSISDTLYNFLSMFYLNEIAGIPEIEILKGRFILDILSIPLILYFAFKINKGNRRRTFALIYAFVPITIGLFLLSMVNPIIPFYPNWIPFAFKRLAFIAYAIKLATDWLWVCLLTPLAMKFAPTDSKAKAIGISWLFVHVSRLIASPIAGWIWQNYMNGALILLCTILVLNGLILLVILLVGDIDDHNKVS